MRHLTVQALLDQIENKAASFDIAAAQAHLDACSQCQQKAQEFQELLTFFAEDSANEPPADVVQRGVDLFQPVLRPGESKPNQLRRIAKRVFDSFEQPLVAGTRQVGVPSRHLLYRAEDIDVDVRVETGLDERQISLAGQVVSGSRRTFEDTPVQLECDGTVRYVTRTNRVGEFSFDEIPEDTYHLCVDLPDGPVRLFCVHRSGVAPS